MKKLTFQILVILIGVILSTPNAFSGDYNHATNNPGVWRCSKIDWDIDNDGVIDGSNKYTYNVDGNYL